MNERIENLRRESLDAIPEISHERATLLTRFYKLEESKGHSLPRLRGMALRFLLENKSLFLGEGELIVGERGQKPKATPTYPEICAHSIEDLQVLNDRAKVAYRVIPETVDFYRQEAIPFWTDRSMRKRIFATLPQTWKDAYEAGVFTEFQEQRAPGHTVCGEKIYYQGFEEMIQLMTTSLDRLDFTTDPHALEKREQWLGMIEAAKGLIALAERYSALLRKEAESCTLASRKTELLSMANICDRVPRFAPRTFWEALQMYWFVHLGVITEFNTWDSFNPGRLDQHLLPFYRKELKEGTLTHEQARELLMAFWIKFNNQPAPPKVGVTAQESSTYTDFCLINLGGLTRDGQDASNELSDLILEVIGEMKLLQPSSMVQVSKKNPDRFLKNALKVVRKGFGQPSIFNTDTIISQLVRQGKDLGDARQGGASGCVETGAFGREAYFLSGYFNLAKILEITLNCGLDPDSKKQIGLTTPAPSSYKNMDELLNAFAKQVRHFTKIKIAGNNLIEQMYARFMPAPFLSLIIDDCLESGQDYHAGGARYNTTYIQGVGVGTVTDSLAAINHHVFEKRTVDMDRFLHCLQEDFSSSEEFRLELVNHTPKYGNDDPAADDFVKKLFEIFYSAVDGQPNSRGGVHRINLLPTTVHVYFGKKVGATPDGRKARTPLSEGISPVQGADRKGPSAVILSASRIDHLRTGGTLLNQKFTPDLLKDEDGLQKILHLVRTYFRLDGHHIQFNVVGIDTLRDAQLHPEKHRDLIVRVAGYSDYFNDLGVDLQEEIIRRTEHGGF